MANISGGYSYNPTLPEFYSTGKAGSAGSAGSADDTKKPGSAGSAGSTTTKGSLQAGSAGSAGSTGSTWTKQDEEKLEAEIAKIDAEIERLTEKQLKEHPIPYHRL